MAFLKFSNIKVAGLSAAVPKTIVRNLKSTASHGAAYDVADFIQSTGVRERRIDPRLSTADLCCAAAEHLLEDLGWNREEIEALIVVTQSGEFILPATSCILQDRLGLPKDCFCEDIGLGCSGWVYGLSSLAALMQGGGIGKAVLLVGDTNLRIPEDDLLFGSAGTVTALEFDESAAPMFFYMGTDGSGYDAIMIPDGGARHPFSENSLIPFEHEGHTYNSVQTQMKGMDVFSFGISTAPKAIKRLCSHFDIKLDDADFLVLHQANRLLNDMIVKKLKFPAVHAPLSLDEFGNTSCASIPLTLVVRLAQELRTAPSRILACGFGVGLSWGTTYIQTDNVKVPNLIEL